MVHDGPSISNRNLNQTFIVTAFGQYIERSIHLFVTSMNYHFGENFDVFPEPE